MNGSAPIGVLGSGVSGLSVLRELLRLLSGERDIDPGDPYGSKLPQTVCLFARQYVRFLADQDIRVLWDFRLILTQCAENTKKFQALCPL